MVGIVGAVGTAPGFPAPGYQYEYRNIFHHIPLGDAFGAFETAVLYLVAFIVIFLLRPGKFAMSNKLPKLNLNHIACFVDRSEQLRNIGVCSHRLVYNFVGETVLNMR